MIQEIAVIAVVPAKAAQFESACAAAYKVIRRAPGCGAVAAS
jgi:hypothetical protein